MHAGERMLAHLLRCEPCRSRVAAIIEAGRLGDRPERWVRVRAIIEQYPTREEGEA